MVVVIEISELRAVAQKAPAAAKTASAPGKFVDLRRRDTFARALRRLTRSKGFIAAVATDAPSDQPEPHSRLRAARLAQGYQSAACAARSEGWNEATYRHHENGTRGFTAEQAKLYAAAFSVTPTWLLDLSDSAAQSDGEEGPTQALAAFVRTPHPICPRCFARPMKSAQMARGQTTESRRRL